MNLSLLHKKIFCILILFCLSYQAFALEANRGLYYFKFTLPQGSNWTQVVDAPDSTGYTKVFIPAYSSSTYPENIQYAFTIADKRSLTQIMQIVVDKDQILPCGIKETHILHSTPNMLLYTIRLDQCPKNASFHGAPSWEVVKSFRMSDGSYLIGYSADPHKVSAAEIKAMSSAIESVSMQLR